MQQYPQCFYMSHKEIMPLVQCQFYNNTECRILTDTNFKKECPFYKPINFNKRGVINEKNTN